MRWTVLEWLRDGPSRHLVRHVFATLAGSAAHQGIVQYAGWTQKSVKMFNLWQYVDASE